MRKKLLIFLAKILKVDLHFMPPSMPLNIIEQKSKLEKMTIVQFFTESRGYQTWSNVLPEEEREILFSSEISKGFCQLIKDYPHLIEKHTIRSETRWLFDFWIKKID